MTLNHHCHTASPGIGDTDKTIFRPYKTSAELGLSRTQSQDSRDVESDRNHPIFKPPRRPPSKPTFLGPSDPIPVFRSYRTSSHTTRSLHDDRKALTLGDANSSLQEAQMQDVITSSAGVLGLKGPENSAPCSTDISISQASLKLDGLTMVTGPDGKYFPLNSLGRLESSSDSIKLQQSSSSDCMSVSSGLSTPPESPPKARCPLCKESVEKSIFEETTGGNRMNIRQQAEFCKAHKIRSARGRWKERGYPDIDWRTFETKLKSLHPRLEKLLQGNTQSYYRNALEDTIRSGKNRTLKQALLQGEATECLSPGYYGSRGAKIMVDNIITHFSSKLRRIGRNDKLISTSGVSGYVQAVLAPELAVMLVMDDMKTDQDGARQILQDSVDIGNLLHEEEDEML